MSAEQHGSLPRKTGKKEGGFGVSGDHYQAKSLVVKWLTEGGAPPKKAWEEEKEEHRRWILPGRLDDEPSSSKDEVSGKGASPRPREDSMIRHIFRRNGFRGRNTRRKTFYLAYWAWEEEKPFALVQVDVKDILDKGMLWLRVHGIKREVIWQWDFGAEFGGSNPDKLQHLRSITLQWGRSSRGSHWEERNTTADWKDPSVLMMKSSTFRFVGRGDRGILEKGRRLGVLRKPRATSLREGDRRKASVPQALGIRI